MLIWELEPIDTEHHNWRASTYQGRLVIRAPDEERARWIASLALDSAVETVLGEDTIFSPWGDKQLVAARRLEEGQYSEAGPEAILDPSEYDHEWQR